MRLTGIGFPQCEGRALGQTDVSRLTCGTERIERRDGFLEFSA